MCVFWKTEMTGVAGYNNNQIKELTRFRSPLTPLRGYGKGIETESAKQSSNQLYRAVLS